MATTKIKLMSPKGIAVYPRLNRPDTKYHELGTYSCDLRLPMDAVTKALLKTLGDAYKAHTGTDHPKKPVRKDKEAIFYFDQLDDGSYVMDFVTLKLRAKNVTVKKTGETWDRKPKLFDAKGAPLDGSLKVGGGSGVKVAFEVDNGIIQKSGDKFTRLIPTAVQIIDLVEFGDATASSYGFGEEDGYEAPEATSSAAFKEATNGQSSSASEDTDEESFY